MARQRKLKGPDLRATRRYLQILCWGYKDFLERSPGKRQPAGDPLSDDVANYWEGWTAATRDAQQQIDWRIKRWQEPKGLR
jgi:hypothetical protein